ncbi:MAG: YhfC family intramembrane metalloprotease [Sandaracinus sp.]|nr:YhfC family intramembrane metalloprotease [Sandaracinus sp.]
MLVAAHVVEVLLLGLGPFLFARAFARRWERPLGIFGVGLICFVFAEVARIVIARGLGALFESGALPMPSDETTLVWVSASLAGVVAALTDQGFRVMALRRWVEPCDGRTGALLGLGHGGGEAMLSAVLVIVMAGIALVGENSTFEDLEAMGFEGRAAVRVGMKVLAWWEASPTDALLAAGQQLCLVVMHLGLSVAVATGLARRASGWVAAAVLLHALVATLLSWIASKTPGLGIELVVHGAAALVGVGFVAAASRGTTDRKTA